MATTTNYGWTTPDDTNLVKNGASDIRTLANAIDSTVKTNDNNAVKATIIDAKGDLLAGTAADTIARLGIGANGTVLTADSGETTGLKWATPAGALTQLATGTMSGTTVTVSSLPSTYQTLYIVIRNWRPDTDARGFKLNFNGDTSANRYATIDTYGFGSAKSFNKDRMDFGTSGQDNSVANGLYIIEIPDYANTSTWKIVRWWGIHTNSTTTTNFDFVTNMGAYNQTSAISSVTFGIEGTGSFNNGSYYVYGIK